MARRTNKEYGKSTKHRKKTSIGSGRGTKFPKNPNSKKYVKKNIGQGGRKR